MRSGTHRVLEGAQHKRPHWAAARWRYPMNTVQLVGRIATGIRLQEFSAASGGTKYKASFLLAVSPPVKGAAPDFVQVETWGVTAQNLVRFNGKGSRISVKGRVRGQFWNP